MQPEQVYTRFYLSLPSRWLVEHLPPRSQHLVLHINKMEEWHVKYCYDQIHNTGELTLGWRKFALDNNLEEFDACVFQPMGKVYGTWLIDVKIFRVVKDITPPTIPKPPSKRGRKRTISNIQTE
ncbi:unnamed protein product [Lupinus luteus]|uniref:TF-B3 domain-containing protein n=1 Tax=Lupinus luteus TaxID=3873 RepID=A0AAV1YFT9_LUPLU